MFGKISINKHLQAILLAAAAAAGIAFLGEIGTEGAALYGDEPWWMIIAAAITFAVTELKALEASEEKQA